MIEYRHFAPKRYKCLYCGYSPLEIWACTYDVVNTRIGNKYEKAEPVLVCTDAPGFKGCGTVFDPIEFDLKRKDLVAK